MIKDTYKDHLFALILAGGGGTRLWPKSRNKTPKQFLKLFENKTLAQITFARFEKILPREKIYCVTVSEEYKKEILREIPQFLPENIIVEPTRRETAPAHGVGAVYIYKQDPDAVIINESVDRLVRPVEKYLTTLKAAAAFAFENKKMVAIGIKPRYAHTGYGYIKRGKRISFSGEIKFYEFLSFKEKPEIKLAEQYLKSGEYFWNAGQFVWRADTLLHSLQKHTLKIASLLNKISEGIGTSSEKEILENTYKLMPKISIDYAVAEKAKNFIVVEADFFWTDIGDWKEVWENREKDKLGNVIIDGEEPGGRVINLDTSEAFIHTDGRLIAVVDVDDIIIVDTKDALLVCAKSKAQNVKKIVERLKEEKENKYL